MVPNIEERVKLLSESPHLTDWERGFCESITSTLQKWGNLTFKQHNLLQKLLLVVEHSEDIKSHAKGAKAVSVLPVGDSQIIWTEERYLKKPKKKKG